MIEDYTDYLYRILFKIRNMESEINQYDQKKVSKIEKSSKKILLNTQRMISKYFPETLRKWKNTQPHDPKGFELTRIFLESKEFDEVQNFSYVKGKKTDFYRQFRKFLKRINQETFQKIAKFSFLKEGELSSDQIYDLVYLINSIYDQAESGLWVKEKKRITIDKMNGFISRGEILACSFSNKIIGCIHIERINENASKFGMLTVDSNYRGFNIGKKFISIVESKAKKEGSQRMRFELFDAATFSHPEKVFLRQWYKELGYKFLKNDKYGWVDEKSLTEIQLEIWDKTI